MKSWGGTIANMAKAVTKIVEVFHWAAAALMVGVTVCSAVYPSWTRDAFASEVKDCCGADLKVYGFEVNARVTDGTVDARALLLFGIVSVLLLSLMAMIFRRLNRIIKNSEGTTPFQSDNVRMLGEVGLLSIAVPAVGFLMSIVTRLVLGADAAEISNHFSGFVIGIVVLCMTQFFARGIELEKDVDGLL